MTALFGPFGGLHKSDSSGRISLGDVERQLRSLGSSAQAAAEASKAGIGTAAAAGGIALVAVTYLFGRRRGKKRSSVLEIRRV